MTEKTFKPETRLTRLGRDPKRQAGCVNPPIYQTSTVIFSKYKDYLAAEEPGLTDPPFYEHDGNTFNADYSYGLTGTPTTYALADAIGEMETGGDEALKVSTQITSSGLSAIAATLMALTDPNDHILVTDAIYGPTRRFCNKQLRKRWGVKVDYYDPLIGSAIGDLVCKNTKVVFVESPGSLTMEVQDIPAIVKAVKDKQPSAIVVMDNTWASPLYFQPFKYGVDVSIQAATKYIAGHSDLVMGAITFKTEPQNDAANRLRDFFRHFGESSSPYDCSQALRGLRTMGARLERHQRTALELAGWLAEHKLVARVLYPAFKEDPGHELWNQQFSGASGLLSFVLDKKYDADAIGEMVDSLDIFGIGASWGGYESLIMPVDSWINASRTVNTWKDCSVIRIHAGLESVEDLRDDLEKGLNCLARRKPGKHS